MTTRYARTKILCSQVKIDMIFAHTLELVLRKQKSQTRRIAKPNQQLVTDNDKSRIEIPGKRVLYQVGKSYAVQPGRGKKAVGRIQLIALRQERLDEISDKDAQAEGFASREAFLQTWRDIHGTDADLKREVWVFEFEICSIHEDKVKDIYGCSNKSGESSHHRKNVPGTDKAVSGSRVLRRSNRKRRMGQTIPN